MEFRLQSPGDVSVPGGLALVVGGNRVYLVFVGKQ